MLPTLLTTPLPTLTLGAQQSLPEGGSVPLAVALIAGLVLWLFGAKLVKPVFFVLGFAIGGFVGATVLPLTGLPPIEIGSVTITPGITGLIAGAIIGSLVALAMFRIVITMTAAFAFAVAGLLGAMVFLHFNPTQPSTTDPIDESSLALNESIDTDPEPVFEDALNREAANRAINALNNQSTDEPFIDDETKQELLDAAERSRAFVERSVKRINHQLESMPARDKMIAFSSMFAGLALGLLVGVTMPTRTSALVTALLGSAVWIGAGVALLTARNGQLPEFLHRSSVVWAAAWILITLLGLVVQLGFLSKPKHESNKSGSDEDE